MSLAQPPTVCAKCGHGTISSGACARCGLLVENWPTYTETVRSHPYLDARWAKLVAAWDEDVAHTRFLDEAARLEALDVAAGRFRARLREDPNDPRAAAGLERSAILAERIHALGSQVNRPTNT